MTQVASHESGDTPKPDSTATTHPPTPPTNPTNSSEPVSPTEKLSSENASIPAQTQASTVPNPPLTSKTESSNTNLPSFEIPNVTTAPTTTTTSAPPLAEVPKSAPPVANPVSNLAPDPTLNHQKDVAPTPTTITVQQSQSNSADIDPSKGELPQKSNQRDHHVSKSESSPPDSHLDPCSSQPQSKAQSEAPKAETPKAETPKAEMHLHSDYPVGLTPKHPPPAPRPQARRLPKVAKNRPENARVFIGNLASEYTSAEDIIQIFQKYGTLIEEPVLRRSFGFVQYSSAESAARAANAEQGRIIGGIGIDLSIADNREVKKGTHVQNNTPFQHSRQQPTYQPTRGRVRERENAGAVPDPRKKRRSMSPTSASRKGGVHPPQYRRFRPEPKNGIHLRILCMSPTAKGYAKHCENTFRNMTGLKADILHILAAGLGEALGRAMRDTIPYVMVVASKDVDDGTCTIRTLEKTGYEKSGRGNGVIPLREAVEVCLIERGVIAPANMTQQTGPPSRPAGTHGGMPMHPRGPPPQGGAQWLNQSHHMPNQVEGGKPGWMIGPRPPHPANQGTQRLPPNMPPQAMPGSAPPGYGYGDGRPPYGHVNPPPPPPPPPPQMHSRPDTYGHSGGQQPYEAASGGGLGPNMNPEYGRGGLTEQYQSHMNQAGGYPDRYAGNQHMGRGNNYGHPNGRDTEYDPATVIPSQRTTQPSGYAPWNRDQRQMGRDMYNNSAQGPGMEPPPDYQPSSQSYSNQMYGSNHNYNDRPGQGYGSERTNHPGQYEDPQSQNYSGRGNHSQYDSYDNGVPYRRDNRRDVNNNMNQQNARYSNDGYNGSNGAYQAGGYPPRDNRGAWDQQQAPSIGPGRGMHGVPNAGSMGYRNEPTPQSQPEGRGYRANFHNMQNQYDDCRPSDAPHNQYHVGNSTGDVRDPRGHQRYGPDRGGNPMPNQQYHSQRNSGNNSQSQAASQAPVSGAGTVDIGKLTNLISAFQQKQQQNSQQSRSQQQQQQQQSQQQDQSHHGQPHHSQPPHSQPPHGQLHSASQNQGPSRAMQGDRQGVAQFLQMPGVQQALQNIGGAGLGGYQGGYQQGMTQQALRMSTSMGQNRGRGPDHGGHPHQGYYG